MSKVANQSINCCFFWPKYSTCLIFLVSRLEAYFVGQTSHPDRPNMSISISLSVTIVSDHGTVERLTILVSRLDKSVAPTKYFFKDPQVGRFKPLVGVTSWLVESPLQSSKPSISDYHLPQKQQRSHRKLKLYLRYISGWGNEGK